MWLVLSQNWTYAVFDHIRAEGHVTTAIGDVMGIDKRHILDEIKRTACANGGKPLGKARFFQETGIKETDWSGRLWVRWGDALREAGFSPNQFNGAFDDTLIFEKLVSLVRELGRFPVVGELKMKSQIDEQFPSHNVFARFGSKRELVAKLLTYCQLNKGYEDVSALCVLTASQKSAIEKDEELTETIGFVYLMKSGRYYKLGRSNAAGRREYELAIQMPEQLNTVHTIRTDDPIGIEAYWHKRFESKRKNGEWFHLTSTDLKTFKRRKFM